MTDAEFQNMLDKMDDDIPDDEYFAFIDVLTREQQSMTLVSAIVTAMWDCGFEFDIKPSNQQEGVPPSLTITDLIELVLRQRRWRGKVDLAHLKA